MTVEETTTPPSSGDQFRSGCSSFLRAVLRLLLVVFFGILLGYGLFFGVPKLYQRYILPVQTRIQDLENARLQQDQNTQQLLQQIQELQKRINALEMRSDTDNQAISELNSYLTAIPLTQQAQLDASSATQAAAKVTVDEINSALETLDNRLARIASALEKTNTEANSLNDQVKSLEGQIQAEDAPVAALRRELQLVKAMELVTRSRLFLVQNNLGTAEQDIIAARDLLAALAVPSYQAEALASIIAHLEAASNSLPETPVLASEELEIAWQLLVRGLPGEPPLVSSTITPTVITNTLPITITIPLTPTVTLDETPTPTTQP